MNRGVRISAGIFLLVAFAIGFSGCNWLNQSIMFKTPKDYTFDTPPDTIIDQYVIQANDLFYFRLFANDGFKLIDLTSSGSSNGGNQNFNLFNSDNSLFQYLVEYDGTVKLPILGRIHVEGLTLREMELMLQEKYSLSFNDPFVQITVLNRRVIVFPGESGQAAVIGLQNNNTTLMEALALAGGLSENGKAQKVKLIRKTDDPNNPLVYQFDLSTIEGLRYANMIVQTEDIIYVEPRRRVALNVMREITPYITLLTTFLLTLTTIQALRSLN
ncbi:polysaccharide biosynthesis/export family protein [bacterium SCSIO 12741]|nr:polysaccharide biosynthesis/export family protein [bacterium SCSIO 12741]